jgi:very-short-patch-repair endonuclease
MMTKASPTNRARTLREQSTAAERRLWQRLKGKQLDGHKFRRQQPIGPYIADFINFDRRLVIELDGGQHAVEKQRDSKRDLWFKTQGYRAMWWLDFGTTRFLKT